MKKKIFSTLLLVAFTLASTSMFVSCKDYDDDINANKDRISKLETTVKDLQASVSTLESCCSTVQGEIDALKSGKADKADLEELSKKYGELSANLVKLEERVQALEDAKQVLEDAIAGKASQADLDALRTELAGIDQKIADALEGYATINYVDAAKNNLQAQIDVFEKYRQALLQYLGLTDDDAAIAKVKEMVDNLKTAISKIGSFPADDLSQAEIDKIRQLLQNEDGEVNKFLTEANVLQFLLTKQLTGLVAYDMNMIGGVEHIEVPAMYYQPVLERVVVKDANGNEKGETEEFHYIDPKTGKVFDADKIDGTSPYLFDCGDMAPKASLGGVHSWKDFATHYGEGDKDQSVLSFYKVLVSEFTRLKTAQLIAHGTFKALTNPSSVDLSNTKFNFFTDTRIWGEEVESREGKDGFAVPMSETVNGKEIGTRYKDGVVEVDFTIPAWEAYVHQIARTADGNYVKNPFAPKDDKDAAEFASLHDSLNWVSLQAQVGEVDGKVSTVSSDFVVVTPALLHVQALADNEPEAKILDCHNLGGWTGKNGLGGHLWKQARTAIDHDPTHSVPFNGDLDILPFIETHFTNLGFFMTWMTYDKKMEADMFRQLGLKYRFALVDYEDGKHKTGETKHMTIDTLYNDKCDFGLKSVIVTPRSVDEKGETIDDKVATREAIDREPLLRVELVDSKNQILEVGYIKFIITDNLEPTFCEATIPYDYYMNCGDEAGITWAQVENLILAKIGELGYTKTQFEAEYELETYKKNADGSNVAGEVAVQYWFDPAAESKKYAKADLADTLGIVKYTYMVPTKYDKEAKQTNVLMWAISEKFNDVARYITGKETAAEARQALLENKGTGYKDHKLITSVKFVKKGVDAKTQEMTAIYVDLIIPGDQVHFAYADADKKDLSHWYDLNKWQNAGSNGENAYEVHMNVPTESWLMNTNGNTREEMDGTKPGTPQIGLTNNEFWRNIYENYMWNTTYNVPDIMTVLNPEHFDKYAYQNANGLYKGKTSFRFILPKNGVNAEFDAAADGTWNVYGYSGRHEGDYPAFNPDAVVEYTLHIDNDGMTIRDNCPVHEMTTATKFRPAEDGVGHIIAEIVDYGNNRQVVLFHNNDHACDILNYAGRYNDNGEDVWATDYFVSKRMFTAYAEVYGDDEPCYPILIDHRYINFKFERPINVWPIYKLVKDGVNVEKSINTMDVLDMITIADWRKYHVTNQDVNNPSNADFDLKYSEYNGDATEAGANMVSMTWPEKMAGKTNYKWFGVQEVYIDRDAVLTDHSLTDAERLANHKLIFEDSKIDYMGKKIYSQEFLRNAIINGDLKYKLGIEVPGFKVSFDYELAGKPTTKDGVAQTRLTLTNNKDNVQLFHYFIPVYVKYAYGEFGKKWGADYNQPVTFKVWTVLTCVNTKNNPDK